MNVNIEFDRFEFYHKDLPELVYTAEIGDWDDSSFYIIMWNWCIDNRLTCITYSIDKVTQLIADGEWIKVKERNEAM
jgi:hypothetical protein